MNTEVLWIAIIGLVYFIAGIILRVKPPKAINGLYGYRTKRSMKSIEAWNFAQEYSSLIMIRYGLIHVAIFLILSVFIQNINIAESLALALIPTFIIAAIPIIQTEKELKKRFDQ